MPVKVFSLGTQARMVNVGDSWRGCSGASQRLDNVGLRFSEVRLHPCPQTGQLHKNLLRTFAL